MYCGDCHANVDQRLKRHNSSKEKERQVKTLCIPLVAQASMSKESHRLQPLMAHHLLLCRCCCCCCCQASECQDQRQKKEERSKACHIVSFSATADRVWLRDDYRQSLRSAPMRMRQEISDIFQRRDGSDGEREMRRDVQESGRGEALHHN